jgi:hypothetical protein
MADREKNEKETDEKKLEQETAVEYEVGYGKATSSAREVIGFCTVTT